VALLVAGTALGTPRDLRDVHQVALEYDFPLQGTPLNNKAQADTAYVIGGADDTSDIGRFEMDGQPNWVGWTSADKTMPSQHWHVSTFNAANLNDQGAGNNAWWCGQSFLDDCDTDNFEGYGNDWDDALDFTATLPFTPGPFTFMQIEFYINNDTEEDWDFTYLLYEDPSGGSFQGDWDKIEGYTAQIENQYANKFVSLGPEQFTGPSRIRSTSAFG
jgi:hypothetical protein